MVQRKDSIASRPGMAFRLAGADQIAAVLSKMTFRERVRAYRSGAFSHHQLAAAAAREPNRMPTLNGEFEWIAISLADLD